MVLNLFWILFSFYQIFVLIQMPKNKSLVTFSMFFLTKNECKSQSIFLKSKLSSWFLFDTTLSLLLFLYFSLSHFLSLSLPLYLSLFNLYLSFAYFLSLYLKHIFSHSISLTRPRNLLCFSHSPALITSSEFDFWDCKNHFATLYKLRKYFLLHHFFLQNHEANHFPNH